MEALHLEIFFDADLGALASEAGLLDAAEGRDFGRDGAGVKADHAKLQCFRHPPGALQAFGVEISGQPKGRAVGDGDRLVFGLEAEERGNGTEGFLAGEQHVRGGAGEHNRGRILPAPRHRPATRRQLCALGNRVFDVAVDLVDRSLIDHRANCDAGLRPRAYLHRVDAGAELLGEGVIDAGLHENSVGADAGLPAIAELRRDRAFHRKIEIGVVENDEGGIAAEFEREPLDAVCSAAHQQRTDAGRAGEGDLAYRLVRHELVTDRRRHARDDIDDAGRNAGALGEHAEGERREGRELRGLDDHRAAGGERRGDLPGDHRVGEIPRRDDGADADRFLQHDDAAVRRRGGNGVAADAAGFFREPFDKGGAVADLATRLLERLALFHRHEHRQIFEVFDHQRVPALEHGGAFGVGFLLPRSEGGIGRFDGRAGFGRSHVGHGAENGLVRRIDDVDDLARSSGDPLTADQAQLPEEFLVLQSHVFIPPVFIPLAISRARRALPR